MPTETASFSIFFSALWARHGWFYLPSFLFDKVIDAFIIQLRKPL
jgi:hypothetical protein